MPITAAFFFFIYKTLTFTRSSSQVMEMSNDSLRWNDAYLSILRVFHISFSLLLLLAYMCVKWLNLPFIFFSFLSSSASHLLHFFSFYLIRMKNIVTHTEKKNAKELEEDERKKNYFFRFFPPHIIIHNNTSKQSKGMFLLPSSNIIPSLHTLFYVHGERSSRRRKNKKCYRIERKISFILMDAFYPFSSFLQ